MTVIVVLAGGLARRLGGGDKALARLGTATLLDHALARLAGQGFPIVLNANGDPDRFARFGLPVAPDSLPDHPGPLAGILAGMEWAARHVPDCPDLLSVPCDSPFLPRDLLARLRAARPGSDIARAASLGRVHPVVALWPVRLAAELRDAMTVEGMRKVEAWSARYRTIEVDFAATPTDPFLNINRPEDLAAAMAVMGAPRSDCGAPVPQ